MALQVGQVLYGYCGGLFGRDSYEDKRIEAIGFDWVVVRAVHTYSESAPDFVHSKTIHQDLEEYLIQSPEEEIGL